MIITISKSIIEIVREFFTWFRNSGMKARPDKSHFLLSDTGCQAMDVCSEKIENSDRKKK